MNNFKSDIKKWLDINQKQDEIKKMSADLKKNKTDIENNILNYMNTKSMKGKNIILGDKQLKYTYNKTQESISKKLILSKLTIFLKNEKLAEDATDFIFSNREVKEKAVLKLGNFKKSKSKNK